MHRTHTITIKTWLVALSLACMLTASALANDEGDAGGGCPPPPTSESTK